MDKLLQWANLAYMGSLIIAAGATFAIYHLSARGQRRQRPRARQVPNRVQDQDNRRGRPKPPRR